ncbi:arabinogalactan protein 41 [Rhodamnia argentea]|uniref:Arabinogalactan protein 41 n=1 Tax=Rhodamnia argentea TaxID=178133 RepID=A0A8B8PGK9_9MYRT|nr:arabinogalactan protein 41 [Rhodamnia argentea]
MGVSKVQFGVFAVVVVMYTAMLLPTSARAQSPAPAPAPAASDGTSIDQGIAYVLMLIALILTYLIH